MSRMPLSLALCLIAFAYACADHKCPPPYMTFGDTCRLCPPGQTRERGMCVPIWDGGVEAVEEGDAGEETSEAEVTEAADGASAEDAGASEEPAAPCYRDLDGDGVGAGEPVDCDIGGSDGLAATATDCDDDDPERSPSLSDICGDHVDNDCDGTPDDNSSNACGGPCNAQLGHQPGEACDNGLKGACARSGTYECQSSTTTSCSAPNVTGSSEVCEDDIDNDCDGLMDEADAIDAIIWYEDCDGDGYSALTDALISAGVGTRRSCVMPGKSSTCVGWTERRPQAGSSWDCDDFSGHYRPDAAFGVPPDGKTRVDLNCDGVDEKSNVAGGGVVCPASWSCETCAADVVAGTRSGSQWLTTSGDPTDSSPPCSKSIRDTFPYRRTDSFLNGSCPNGVWGQTGGWGGFGNGALQACR